MITKELLQDYINQNLSARKIAKKFNVCYATIRYWLKFYGLKTNFNRGGQFDILPIINGEKHKTCSRCSEQKPLTDFYLKKGSQLRHAYCKKCCNHLTVEKYRSVKIQALEYKGGKCIICGYNKCPGAMHFHHLDPSQKEFHFSFNKQKSLKDHIKKELDKCVLVCANCHSEIHSGLVKVPE